MEPKSENTSTEDRAQKSTKAPNSLFDSNTITNMLISIAGAVGADYLLFVQPLKKEVEAHLAKLNSFEKEVAEQKEINKAFEQRVKNLEEKIEAISRQFTSPGKNAMSAPLSEKYPLFRDIFRQINNIEEGHSGNPEPQFTGRANEGSVQVKRVTF